MLEAQFFGYIEIEQFRARRGELEALANHLRADEKPGCNIVDAQALVMQVLESPELIERMQRLGYASSVLLARRR
ncbi:MAG: hypothetical protein WBS22_19675 [Methylocystis sp.]